MNPTVYERCVSGGKLQRQLARADRRAARHALVLGSSELASGRGKLKTMQGGTEEEVALADLASELRKRTGGRS